MDEVKGVALILFDVACSDNDDGIEFGRFAEHELEVGFEDLNFYIEVTLVLVHKFVLLVDDLFITGLNDRNHKVKHNDLVENRVHEPHEPNERDQDVYWPARRIIVAMHTLVLVHLRVFL